MKIELTLDEIGWVKYSLVRVSSSLEGRDPDLPRSEGNQLLRIAKKIEKQQEEYLK